jgi:high-affinity nickel-transport protein
VNLGAILALGFFLGMRHATDADHVVAVSTIVSQQRTLRAAAPIGVLWGLGHTLTLLLVGGAIVLFGIVVPPHVGLALELAVAVMLVLLGAFGVRGALREERSSGSSHGDPSEGLPPRSAPRSWRPLVVGVVHGVAGSAAVALLVLGAIHDATWAIGYLLVFGAGTVAGMLLITTALAVPLAVAARRFRRFHRALVVGTGVASIAFGGAIVYEVGFVHGLFTDHPRWTPE